MQPARRMDGLSQAIFSEMAALAREVESSGTDIINLGIGSPDGPPADHIKQALRDALDAPDIFGYPSTEGSPEFREAVAAWYKRRFGVSIDPDTQVHSLMGSQDGLAHLALSYVNPGDGALIPDPGYPIYSGGVVLAGGRVIPMPLRESSGFLPDFASISESDAKAAKLMILNYPNNPLSVTADYGFLAEAVDFAGRNDIVLCYDNAYSELAFDGFVPPSIMQVPGASDICVEFNSLSKSFNLAGARIAYAVGNPHIISALGRIKSNIDYGVFKAVQAAATAALNGPGEASRHAMERYQHRRNILIDGLKAKGWSIPYPKATMFVWAPIPRGTGTSMEFAKALLKTAGVLVIPGNAFGRMGEGYVRMALVHPPDILEQAAERIGSFLETIVPAV